MTAFVQLSGTSDERSRPSGYAPNRSSEAVARMAELGGNEQFSYLGSRPDSGCVRCHSVAEVGWAEVSDDCCLRCLPALVMSRCQIAVCGPSSYGGGTRIKPRIHPK